MKPIIKFNGGTPVCICNKCRKIICYVKWDEEKGKYVPGTSILNEKPSYEDTPLFCQKHEK